MNLNAEVRTGISDVVRDSRVVTESDARDEQELLQSAPSRQCVSDNQHHWIYPKWLTTFSSYHGKVSHSSFYTAQHAASDAQHLSRQGPSCEMVHNHGPQSEGKDRQGRNTTRARSPDAHV